MYPNAITPVHLTTRLPIIRPYLPLLSFCILLIFLSLRVFIAFVGIEETRYKTTTISTDEIHATQSRIQKIIEEMKTF